MYDHNAVMKNILSLCMNIDRMAAQAYKTFSDAS